MVARSVADHLPLARLWTREQALSVRSSASTSLSGSRSAPFRFSSFSHLPSGAPPSLSRGIGHFGAHSSSVLYRMARGAEAEAMSLGTYNHEHSLSLSLGLC
ncbi:unnamed protein product [Musa banksii]